MRVQHMAALAADLNQSEARHARRLGEARARMREWHEADVRRFEGRSQTVGDYVW